MPSSTPDWSALASDNERLVTVTAPGGAGSDKPGGPDRQTRRRLPRQPASPPRLPSGTAYALASGQRTPAPAIQLAGCRLIGQLDPASADAPSGAPAGSPRDPA